MLDARVTGLSTYDFARRFALEEDIAILRADAFGDSATGHLRISLGVADSESTEWNCACPATSSGSIGLA